MAQPALAVANHFLRLAQKDGEGISPLKMQKLVADVWDKYKRYSGIQLANWSHEPGSPWYNATNRDAVEESIIIDDNAIKSYFWELRT